MYCSVCLMLLMQCILKSIVKVIAILLKTVFGVHIPLFIFILYFLLTLYQKVEAQKFTNMKACG